MNGNRKIRIVSLLTVLTIFLLVSSSCGGGASPSPVTISEPPVNQGAEEQPTPTLMVQAPTPTPLAQKNYEIGDIIPIGNSVLVVLGWENVSTENLNSSFQPKEGNNFVAVELVIINNDSTTFRVNEMRQVSMVDDKGQKYETDFDAFAAIGLTGSNSIDGELAPGERVRGKPGFQIPENTQTLQFIFDASDFGAGKITVDLGAEPVTVELPAELAGDASQQTYNVGDFIAIGTATLTVHGVQYPAGDQFSKPKAGYKFLVVDLTIENKGATEILFSVLDQPSLKDSNGQQYYFSQPASGSSFFGGNIAPGEKLDGQVGFEVPENSSGFIFVFDARSWGSERILVALP